MHLHYRESGRGEPLFCLHGGMGLDHHIFLPWLEELAPVARVILFDFSGNGASRSDLPPEELSHDVWVEDIETLRQHLGLDRISLLGHSYGGLLAQAYALRHPGRISKLVLSNTAPVVDFGSVIVANAQARGTPAQVEEALRVLTSPAAGDREMEDGFSELLPLYFHQWNAEAGRTLLEGVGFRATAFNAGNGHELGAFDTRERLGELRSPVLVISGGDDWIMPREHGGRRLAELIPGARHVVLEKSGHFPFVEETEAFVDAVATFLKEAD